MESLTGELPIQLLDNLASILGCRSKDDVLGIPSAIMPQLLSGTIHGLLVALMVWTVSLVFSCCPSCHE